MSVVVGVVSRNAAAIATDSLHVDLQGGGVTTGFVKHVRVAGRAAGVVGVAEVGGHAALTWVGQALAEARTLPEVPGALVVAGGLDLRDAYLAWRRVVGPEPDASEFLSVIVISTEQPAPAALELWATETHGALTLEGSHSVAGEHSIVVTGGAVDDALLGHTEFGRLTRQAAVLQGMSPDLPDAAHLRGAADGAACERHARALVREQISRQATIPRPVWWPVGTPVAAAPIHSAVV